MSSHSKFVEASHNNDAESDSSKNVEANLDPKPADDIEECVHIAGATLILLGLIREIQNVPADEKVTALVVIPAICWIIAFITMFICLIFMIHHKKSRYQPLLILAMIAVAVYYILVVAAGLIQHLK